MTMTTTRAYVCRLCLLLTAFAPLADACLAADLAKPVTLVATSRLAGSAYGETVVVAVPGPGGVHIGVIVNRPTDVRLGELFPQHEPSRAVVEPVYIGGPSLANMLYAIVRTTPPYGDDALELAPGVVLVFDANAVDRVIETAPNQARYFVGLIVWAPDALEDEVSAGAWQVNPADASTIFPTDPKDLWKSLSRRAGQFEARGPAEAQFACVAGAPLTASGSGT